MLGARRRCLAALAVGLSGVAVFAGETAGGLHVDEKAASLRLHEDHYAAPAARTQ